MANKWMICPCCGGDGKCVNPSIDAQGLTAADFADDPEFEENYFGGLYDEPCRACDGSGKIREGAIAKLDEAAEDRRMRAAENGDFFGYSTAYDYRWGY